MKCSDKWLRQQIERLFEHWRQNTEGSDAVLKSVEYRVSLLLDERKKELQERFLEASNISDAVIHIKEVLG